MKKCGIMSEKIVPEEIIISKIFNIRGQKVMLDRDLALLYGVETRRLNEQVKRNIERFPESFMFKITDQEVENLVSQNAIPSKQILGGSLPNVFTEHGVLMIANVLKSGKAIEVSLKIIEIFVKLRSVILSNKEILIRLEQMDKRLVMQGHDIKMHDDEIETIFELIKEIMNEKKRLQEPKNPIGFKTYPIKK